MCFMILITMYVFLHERFCWQSGYSIQVLPTAYALAKSRHGVFLQLVCLPFVRRIPLLFLGGSRGRSTDSCLSSNPVRTPLSGNFFPLTTFRLTTQKTASRRRNGQFHGMRESDGQLKSGWLGTISRGSGGWLSRWQLWIFRASLENGRKTANTLCRLTNYW